MTRGLYRRKKLGRRGKLLDAGAYVLDMRIKRVPQLAGLKPRLFKTTGVFPGMRNAETIVREMKLMIKELILNRDVSTLRRIQENKLSVASAYEAWKGGRIHLAQGYEDQPIAKLWRRYYQRAALAETTKVNRLAIIASLIAKKLMSEDSVINDLPVILPRIRHHYTLKKQAPAFNTIRIEVKAFLTNGLSMDSSSPLVRVVDNTSLMKPSRRRDHHPFFSPHECVEFCQQLRKRSTPHADLYVASVLFMCMHGLRPEEFAGKRFAVDEETEHLRILGTKNPNAERVVPYSWKFVSQSPPRIDTLNRTFERMKTKTRCRDFRRTFALWCEAAGIPNSRVEAYMGHAAQTVTQTYQQSVPKQMTLDADRITLRKWFEAELAKAPRKREQVAPLSAFRAMYTALSPSLGQKLERIRREKESDVGSS